MSSGSLLRQLRHISDRAARLQAEAEYLAEELSEILAPEQFGDWVLVDDSFFPLSEEHLQDLALRLKLCGVETGPPELPSYLFEVLNKVLAAPERVISVRADKAFFAGFYAKCSFDTETDYSQSVKDPDFEAHHWVIFYRIDRHLRRRVSTVRCLEVALEVESRAVWESFETVAELSIFCAGAQESPW